VKRAVVDPSVLVSAFLGSPAAGPGQLVAAWRDYRFVMILSPQLLAELGEVLARPKFERWAGEERGTAYVAAFAAQSELHADPEDDDGGHVRDADDDYLVALARAATVDAIISLDRDLLDAQLADLAVMDPARFLADL
jgi:putative PIN family toxin of toxin-antitoxin system